MKFISWNVNGIRAAIKKGFCHFFDDIDADFFCIQETKARPEQVDLNWNNKHHSYWNSAEKPVIQELLFLVKLNLKMCSMVSAPKNMIQKEE